MSTLENDPFAPGYALTSQLVRGPSDRPTLERLHSDLDELAKMLR